MEVARNAPNKAAYINGTAVPFALPWIAGQPDERYETVAAIVGSGKWQDVFGDMESLYLCEYTSTV